MRISDDTQVKERAQIVEETLWRALDMDRLDDEMIEGSFTGAGSELMGTGHTHNACYMCSNSATTAGCGTCG